MKAVVVGGGIGGLAAAVALGRAGHEVEVLERAGALAEVGSGLSLWPNAVRALDALGVGEQVRRRSRRASDSGLRDAAGRWLSRIDLGDLERRFGPLVVIHRAELLEVLRSAVLASTLRTGVTVTSAHRMGTVVHSGGVTRAEVVVGADGIHSAVRRSGWPHAPGPRYVGYSAYRMVTAPVPLDGAGESWGRGERFGYAPLRDGDRQVKWAHPPVPWAREPPDAQRAAGVPSLLGHRRRHRGLPGQCRVLVRRWCGYRPGRIRPCS